MSRVSHTAVFDSPNNLLIAFGGHFAFFGTDHNDIRFLSNANATASPSTWMGLSPLGSPPGIRSAHATAYDRINSRMIVFGGDNLVSTCCPYNIVQYNDTWVLSKANGIGGMPTWTQLFPAGPLPNPRGSTGAGHGHSAVYDEVNDRLLVFGGLEWSNPAQDGVFLGDLWELSHANGLGGMPVWTQLSQSGAVPGPRFTHGAAFDSANQRMIVFGGREPGGGLQTNRVRVLIFNQDPTANAGADQSIECASPGSTPVALDGSGSSDPDAGQTLRYTWTWSIGGQDFSADGVSPNINLPLGTHTITLTVNDGNGGTASDTVQISIHVRVEGLLPPLAALVPEGDSALPPNHAFKQGSTLPLKLQMFCGGTALTDVDVPAPRIVALMRNGDAIVLSTLDLDAGEANDSGTAFRYSAPNWVYNLNTQGLSAGSYVITIELPDGRRVQAAFVLR